MIVLDLACGDGYLLAGLAERRQHGLSLVGVDMSEGELAKARALLGDDALLLCERAQSLSIASASVDIVLSHMALMLMDDVDQVMSEVRRVLKPGGVFSAIVGGGKPDNRIFDVWVRLLRPAMEEDGVAGMRFGDPRTRTAEGLRALCGKDFTDIRVYELEVSWDAPAQGLWDWFGYTYDVDRLSPAARDKLQASFLREIAPFANAGGLIRCTDNLRQVVAAAA